MKNPPQFYWNFGGFLSTQLPQAISLGEAEYPCEAITLAVGE